MSVDNRPLTAELRNLTERLKRRCLEAEARVMDLQRQLDEQQVQLDRLKSERDTLDTKYRNLQMGLDATGGDPARIAQLREQYLAMVSEIDACIDMLQHG